MHPSNKSKRPQKRGALSGILRLFKILLFVILLVPLSALAINLFVCLSTTNDMHSAEELAHTRVDTILVLGAGIEPDGTPSPILAERLDTAIQLYESGTASNIIVSGGTDAAESEVTAMHNYLYTAGIPSEAIVSDDQGVNTYASVNNLANRYHVQSTVIVSQRFHLYRALYIAEQHGLTAYGCPSSDEGISDTNLLLREFFARIKDFAQSTFGELPSPLAALAQDSYHQVTSAL